MVLTVPLNNNKQQINFHFWKRCLTWPRTPSSHWMQLYFLPSKRKRSFFFLQKKHEETNRGPKSDTESSPELHCRAPMLRNELHPVHTAVLTQHRVTWAFFAVAHLVKMLLKRLFIQSHHKYKMPFNNQLSGRHLHSRLFSHQSGYLLEGTIMHIKSHFIISFQVGICAPGCLVISGSHFSGV